MTLYEASVLDIAKAVASKQPAEKKPRTEKQIAAAAKAAETRRLRKEAELAKAVEAEAKKQEDAEIEAKKAEINIQKELLLRKKEEQAKKRAAKAVAKAMADVAAQEASPAESESSGVSEQVETVLKRKRVVKEKDPLEPPKWFNDYIKGVKEEQNQINPVSQKKLRVETKEVAKEKWNDGMTRDRVQNEVDGHMGRMYQMMFGKR